MFNKTLGTVLFFCLTTHLAGVANCQEPAVLAEPAVLILPALPTQPAVATESSDADKTDAEKAAAREQALQKAKERRELLIKQMQEQQAKEKAAALAKQSEYPYQSTKFIPVQNKADNGRLFSFCMGADEKLYCLLIPSNSGNPYQLEGGQPSKQVTATPEVVVLNLEGEELLRWPVGFKPDRITTTAAGVVYVGGTGKLAKFSPQGKLLSEIDLPHIAEALKNEDEIKAAAIEERDEQLEMYQAQVTQYEQYVAKKRELEEKAKAEQREKPEQNAKKAAADQATQAGVISLIEDDEVLDQETMYLRLPLAQLRSMLAAMQKRLALIKDKSEADLVKDFKQALSSKNTIHALTMAGDSLIYTTRQTRGYGYAVWKLNAELAEPMQIVQGLGGCCGQCDVQCHDGKLYIADNTKHRVTVYDLSGKKLAQYGKKGRDGDGENFGGCCNPMNVSFTSTGQILTAESEGYIKCFSADGQFEALLGRSLLEAGCKHVALNMTKDGRYIVFLDQPGSRLVRLEKSAVKPSETKTTATEASQGKASE